MAAANALLTWNKLQAVKRSQRKSRSPSVESETNVGFGKDNPVKRSRLGDCLEGSLSRQKGIKCYLFHSILQQLNNKDFV
jgi:hypothetical protein